MKKIKNYKYMIGFSGRKQVVYGKNIDGQSQYCDPMTLFQARIAVKTLFKAKAKRYIFKLVPVEEI